MISRKKSATCPLYAYLEFPIHPKKKGWTWQQQKLWTVGVAAFQSPLLLVSSTEALLEVAFLPCVSVPVLFVPFLPSFLPIFFLALSMFAWSSLFFVDPYPLIVSLIFSLFFGLLKYCVCIMLREGTYLMLREVGSFSFETQELERLSVFKSHEG